MIDKKRETIEDLYYGRLNPSEKTPKTEEYKQVVHKLNILSKKFLKESNVKNIFREYEEISNIKGSIEAEQQFKNGFDLAVN